MCQITHWLEALGLLTARGKKRWSVSSVKSILTNEKYMGDALLQKSYTIDFLTKKKATNQGEVPQHYVQGNHELIIVPAVLDYVQTLFNPTAKAGQRPRNTKKHPLSARIRCGRCGSWYGPKTWHSTSKYRRTIWRCNAKYEQHTCCTTPHMTEEQIIKAFNKAVSQLIDLARVNRKADRLILKRLNPHALEQKTAQALEELETAQEGFTDLTRSNARAKFDPEEYRKRSEQAEARYQSALEAYNTLSQVLDQVRARRVRYEHYIKECNQLDESSTYTPLLWRTLVDHVTVGIDGTFEFTFHDGTASRCEHGHFRAAAPTHTDGEVGVFIFSVKPRQS